MAAGNARRYSAKRLFVGCGIRTYRLDDRVVSACGRRLGNDLQSFMSNRGPDLIPRILPKVRILPRPFVAFSGIGRRESKSKPLAKRTLAP
jgi:hypothetical protein